MAPEEKAREKIDTMLVASCWIVQTKDNINLAARCGADIWKLSFFLIEQGCTLFTEGKAFVAAEAKPGGVALDQQTRIVAEVERRLSVVVELKAVVELEAAVSANLQRATRLRQSILQKAFTGGLCERGEIHHHQERHAS